jgi:hypothetical protein
MFPIHTNGHLTGGAEQTMTVPEAFRFAGNETLPFKASLAPLSMSDIGMYQQ